MYNGIELLIIQQIGQDSINRKKNQCDNKQIKYNWASTNPI